MKWVVILWKNNYAALKIIDLGIFRFYFIKISFPVHFLFKLRQNLSARPRTINIIYTIYKIYYIYFIYIIYYIFKTAIPSNNYDRPKTTEECGMF